MNEQNEQMRNNRSQIAELIKNDPELRGTFFDMFFTALAKDVSRNVGSNYTPGPKDINLGQMTDVEAILNALRYQVGTEFDDAQAGFELNPTPSDGHKITSTINLMDSITKLLFSFIGARLFSEGCPPYESFGVGVNCTLYATPLKTKEDLMEEIMGGDKGLNALLAALTHGGSPVGAPPHFNAEFLDDEDDPGILIFGNLGSEGDSKSIMDMLSEGGGCSSCEKHDCPGKSPLSTDGDAEE